MNLRNLFNYGFITIFIFQCAIQNAIGMESSDQEDKLLVIGCRPWDENMQGFSGLRTAHFVDFMDMAAPSIIPSTFYHFDLNDECLYNSGKFSDFAASNLGKYRTIIVDWITYQHIRRDGAWSDFSSLLNADGNLIIPVTYTDFKKGPISFKKAEEFINEKKLNDFFRPIQILNYNEVSQDTRFDLLHRPNLEPGRLKVHLDMDPAIIIAKRQNSTIGDVEVISENQLMIPERSEINTPFPGSTIEEMALGLDLSPIAAAVKAIEEEMKDKNIEKQGSPTTYVPYDGKREEVKIPSLTNIKESIIEGKSILSSETNNLFSIQFFGQSSYSFSPETIAEGFDLKLKYVGNSENKGLYHLSLFFHMINNRSKLHIPFFLKSMNGQRNIHQIYGGTLQTKIPGYYEVSDPGQIKIFRE